MGGEETAGRGRPRAVVDAEYETLWRLYITDELGSRTVGRRLGVSHQTVLNRLRELGIPLRPKNQRVVLVEAEG